MEGSDEWKRVRQDYRNSLAELTFPAKPLINTLTMTADQNMRYGSAIVQAIELQLRNVQPNLKLSLLYLMDSIIKNVGKDYVALFAKNLYQSFTAAYLSVDRDTQYKFKRVYDTWPGFLPPGQLRMIGEFFEAQQPPRVVAAAAAVMPTTSIHQPPPPVVFEQPYHQHLHQPIPPPPQPAPPPPPPRDPMEIMHLIDTLLLYKRQTDTGDNLQTEQQMVLLEKLLAFVKTHNLDPGQLETVRTQVMAIWPPNLPITSPHAIPQVHYGMQPGGGDGSTTPPLINNTGATSTASAAPFDPKNVKLSTEAINQKQHPLACEEIYGHLRLQCKQCGFRFADDEDGKSGMAAHMDWHFRQNRKFSSDDSKQSHSRNWFLTEQDWIHLRDVDTTSAQKPEFFDGSADAVDSNSAVAAGGVWSEQQPHQQQQRITMEHGVKQSCHECHEDFKTVWDEDSEEWILKDAIRAENKLYHRQCYAEILGVGGGQASSGKTVLGKRKPKATTE